MSKCLIRIAAIIGTLSASAYGQLYLMTGSPTPKYNETFSSVLFQVTEGGNVNPIAELVSKEAGTEWIALSNDWRKVVILPGYKDNRVIVVDLDRPAIVKACQRPQLTNTSLIEQWLADLPGTGPSFVWYVTGDDPLSGVVQAMSLDPMIPCNESFPPVDGNAATYLVASGVSGVADLGSSEGTNVGINETGRVRTYLAGLTVDLGYQVPAQFFPIHLASIAANNRQVLVLSTFHEKTGRQTLAFRKSDKTWHAIPFRTDGYGCVRVFGGLIAVAESEGKQNATVESAGRAEWRKAATAQGPSLADRLGGARAVFPGRLHIYDIDTEKIYTIRTDQADSEILLIEDHTVYYRVTDNLYAAEITNTGLGKPRLLAKADAVRDAHWAFLKH